MKVFSSGNRSTPEGGKLVLQLGGVVGTGRDVIIPLACVLKSYLLGVLFMLLLEPGQHTHTHSHNRGLQSAF